MNCDTCTHRPDPVPFAVHESAMARTERTIRRLWILLIVLVVLLVGSNALWIWYESQMEYYEEESSSYEIDQETSDGGSNYTIGRDYYGTSTNQSDENEDEWSAP